MQKFKNEQNELYGHRGPNGSMGSTIRRWAPLVAGTTLAIVGVSRKTKSGAALAAAGGALAYFGSRTNQSQEDSLAHGSVLLNCSPEEAYRVYRNFEELPRFMRHLESVSKIGDRQYRWKAIGPMGMPIQWDAEVLEDRPGDLISWRSLSNSAVSVEGSVTFETAPGNRGTVVSAVTRYDHPSGDLGRSISKLLGKDPSFLMQQDLRRFKAFVETGEIPTVKGQSHGPRSRMTGVLRAVNPDESIPRKARMSEILETNRRTA